jgi:adhesin transport system membrane fusion protein
MSTQPDTNPEDKAKLTLGGRTDNYVAKAILLEEAAPPAYMLSLIHI